MLTGNLVWSDEFNTLFFQELFALHRHEVTGKRRLDDAMLEDVAVMHGHGRRVRGSGVENKAGAAAVGEGGEDSVFNKKESWNFVLFEHELGQLFSTMFLIPRCFREKYRMKLGIGLDHLAVGVVHYLKKKESNI